MRYDLSHVTRYGRRGVIRLLLFLAGLWRDYRDALRNEA